MKESRDYLSYKVGGLLYMPAFQESIADKIKKRTISCLTSVALCLEDAIKDEMLIEAEAELSVILEELYPLYIEEGKDNPLLFVRVRSPEHLRRVAGSLKNKQNILTGYILPKFDLTNGAAYISVIKDINKGRENPLYIMPVLESEMLANAFERHDNLRKLKMLLDAIYNLVLNIRVGGNDFSNLYGLRRPVNATIYDICVVRDILTDILNVFGKDYVVSGAVWEYFGEYSDADWANGLVEELRLDSINGFIGKTAIHPSQLPFIYESLKVEPADYEDALEILNWREDKLGVTKSAHGNRMNEVKTHAKWARRVKILGDIYGIKD